MGKDDLSGCPPATYPSDPGRIIPTGYGGGFANIPNAPPKGQFSFKFNKSGGYAMAFRALRSGNQVFFDEKPIRVGCGFAIFNVATSLTAANTSSVTTGEVAGPPLERMSGYRMSEQDTPAPEGVEPQP